VIEDPAVQEGVDRVLDRPAPEAVAALEALFPRPLDLLVQGIHELEQR
jgi:hypothetical protein